MALIVRIHPFRLVISIEYDVAVVDTAKYAQSPLLVEVERSCAALLGISLTSSSCDKNRRIYIESITPASIAERYFPSISPTSKSDAAALRAASQLVGLAWNLAMSFDERCSRG